MRYVCVCTSKKGLIFYLLRNNKEAGSRIEFPREVKSAKQYQVFLPSDVYDEILFPDVLYDGVYMKIIAYLNNIP